MKSAFKWLFLCVGVVAAIALFLFIAVQVNRVMDYPDYGAYWLAGKLVQEGANPYDPEAWRQGTPLIIWPQDDTFLYPIPTAVFFVPWGMLDLRFSYMLWMFFSMVSVCAAVLLVISNWSAGKAAHFILPVFAGVLVFRPLIVSIRNGQIAGPLFLAFIAALILLEKKRWVSGGMVLGFLFLKPNLALAALIPLGIYFLVNRRWKAIFGLSLSAVIFMGVGWFVDANWIGKFLQIGDNKMSISIDHSPSIWGLVSQLCPNGAACALPLGITFSAVFVGIFIFMVWKYRPTLFTAASAGICLGLLITPFGWTYEQVFMLLPLTWLVLSLSVRLPFLLSSLVFLGFSILSLATLIIAGMVGHDVWSCIVPMVGFIAFVNEMVRQKQPRNPLPV